MRHLDAVYETRAAGDAIADYRMRLETPEFRAAVASAASRLVGAGIQQRDVVATVMANRVEMVITLYALWDIGAVVTPINPSLTHDEIEFQLKDSDAKLAVVDEDRAENLSIPAMPANTLLEASSARPRLRRAAELEDLALLVYTSGTTGSPKGVMIDHGNLDAMTTMLLERNPLTSEDRALVVLPLFHVNAIMLGVVIVLAVGASVYLEPRFDPQTFWSTVEREQISFFSAVPAIYNILNVLPEDVRPDTTRLRFAVCGAAPMRTQAIEAFEKRYHVPIVEGYGLSESTVALTSNPIGARRPGSVGLPFPGVEVRIVDEQGHQLPPGLDGEVIARGPIVMRGYLNRPKDTTSTLREGWLHTGDVGHLDDDGYLVLVDRKKDLIIRGGENISPAEVESMLEAHASVHQAAVVGRPDSVMGEEPVAFVVPSPGFVIDEEVLQNHCREGLAPFKIPRTIFTVEALPRNAVGKVTKELLRARLLTKEVTS